ncbi:hypothetical protein C7M84_003136 [Penaeus vannamei]|uniref:Uncharacterized protein n=1 Tax=Penaeus vannamei TaxID=6689 RepID=A0A3R7P844_PENVA|nr:hypothetical protein C7M84_003136 [Penaeus vannamei]
MEARRAREGVSGAGGRGERVPRGVGLSTARRASLSSSIIPLHSFHLHHQSVHISIFPKFTLIFFPHTHPTPYLSTYALRQYHPLYIFPLYAVYYHLYLSTRLSLLLPICQSTLNLPFHLPTLSPTPFACPPPPLPSPLPLPLDTNPPCTLPFHYQPFPFPFSLTHPSPFNSSLLLTFSPTSPFPSPLQTTEPSPLPSRNPITIPAPAHPPFPLPFIPTRSSSPNLHPFPSYLQPPYLFPYPPYPLSLPPFPFNTHLTPFLTPYTLLFPSIPTLTLSPSIPSPFPSNTYYPLSYPLFPSIPTLSPSPPFPSIPTFPLFPLQTPPHFPSNHLTPFPPSSLNTHLPPLPFPPITQLSPPFPHIPTSPSPSPLQNTHLSPSLSPLNTHPTPLPLTKKGENESKHRSGKNHK